MPLTQDDIINNLLRARKMGETRDWAIVGYDDSNSTNPFAAQTDTGETNVFYARIKGNPDPQVIYYSPADDMRPIANGARILLEYRNGKAWLYGADKEFLTQQQAGAALPTHNFPLKTHDHTSADEGGSLGADTVDTTQIVDDAVTTAKIDALAVTSAELASNAVTTAKITDANVTLAKMATNSVDTANIVDDAVTPTKTDGLSGSSVAFVTQTAGNTFSSIDYSLTSNTRLYYDGTDIRSAFVYAENSGTAITGITTTPVTFATSPDMAGQVDTSASVIRITHNFTWRGDTVGDIFNVVFEYNYDNAGSEAWQNVLSRWMSVIVETANYAKSFNIVSFFDASTATSPTWGYSGTYKLRTQMYRTSGTGTGTIFGTGVNQRISIWEEI